MAEYVAVTAVYQPREKGEDLFIRAGGTVELSDEQAQPLLDRGAIRLPDEPAPVAQEGEPGLTEQQYAELVAGRPGNTASRESWLSYARTVPGLEVPDDAKRDQLITVVDQRLEELQP